MKRILLLAGVVLLMLASCKTETKYTINGVVEGGENGTVYLVKYVDKVLDTLASASIVDRKFKLEGKVDDIYHAFLTIAEKEGGVPFLLENTAFTATINLENLKSSKIEGSENQELYNKFNAFTNAVAEREEELTPEFVAATEANDMQRVDEIRNIFAAFKEETGKREEELLEANMDSPVAAYVVTSKMLYLDLNALTEINDKLGRNARNTSFGREIIKRIEKLGTVTIGKKAPDFTQETPDGSTISLYEIQGKVKIVDFWASWCRPCRLANPEIVSLYAEFHEKGLEILGVSLDNNKNA